MTYYFLVNMKKIFFTILAAVVISFFAINANAQMMRGFSNSTADWNETVEHTAREEAEGKAVWQKLQSKELTCKDLSDDNFGTLGEYFMGAMLGNSHAAMNAMIIQMHGEDGEEQMHVVMGKRLSGCDTSAALPAGSGGWMPMMQMMGGGWSYPFKTNQSGNYMMWGISNNPMGWGFGAFGWIFMVLWWVLIIAGIVALIKWFTVQYRGRHGRGRSALDILKERYARGEIEKKEFEEKKRDLA